MPKGWVQEPIRHGLARKGIKSGRKTSFVVVPAQRLPKRFEEAEKAFTKFGNKDMGFDIAKKDKGEVKRLDELVKSDSKSGKVIDAEFKIITDDKGKQIKVPLTEKEIVAKRQARELQVRKAGELTKGAVKGVGRGVKKVVTGAVRVAEFLSPPEPKPMIKHDINVLGTGGVSIKRRDLTAEAKKRKEAEFVRSRTTFIKKI